MLLSVQVFDNPALVKAKNSVIKANLFQAREPKWIQRWVLHICCCLGLAVLHVGRSTVEKLLHFSEEHREYRVYALLFLTAYAFLLRLPSEALPITAGGDGPCRLVREGKHLVLTLKRRKNKITGMVHDMRLVVITFVRHVM